MIHNIIINNIPCASCAYKDKQLKTIQHVVKMIVRIIYIIKLDTAHIKMVTKLAILTMPPPSPPVSTHVVEFDDNYLAIVATHHKYCV